MADYLKTSLYALALTVGLGGTACEKPLEPVKPSQLEQVVHASAKVEAKEESSTPIEVTLIELVRSVNQEDYNSFARIKRFKDARKLPNEFNEYLEEMKQNNITRFELGRVTESQIRADGQVKVKFTLIGHKVDGTQVMYPQSCTLRKDGDAYAFLKD